KENGSKRRKIW
ncbi:10 kDa chaperonin, partial [Haemophilus influenzae]